jgi:hypothetical protein
VSLQRAQHLGEIVDHRTKVTRVIALVRATSQFPADDQMFRPRAVAIERYRYRGTKIPTPWSSATTTGPTAPAA